mmetsp:Transcript_25079/g.72387  ORF Transcript_25079/g.72387 Transcript_25079/m.72387 type:complete len:134 (-) Transcript_25079:1112-1513(-)
MMLKGVENDRSCRLSVPAHIDEVWHSVLVDPVLYMSLSRIVGIEPVIPHDPMGEYDSDELKMRRRQAALDKFAELYGRPYTHNYCGGQVAARHQDNYVLTQPPTREEFSRFIKVCARPSRAKPSSCGPAQTPR